MIHYFVSYAFQAPNGSTSMANTNLPMTEPIRSMDDVAVITRWLVSQGVRNPIVLSFCRFDGQGDGGQRR
jgi:hypothetical protein